MEIFAEYLALLCNFYQLETARVISFHNIVSSLLVLIRLSFNLFSLCTLCYLFILPFA